MQYKKTKLKNGLRVVTAPITGTETVTVMIAVGVGSRYETEKEAGLSHFIEHMMFKGTKKRPNTQIITSELDAIGGEFNAFTGKDKTVYYAKTDAKHLDTALDVISDMYLNSKLDPKEIAREKGTILQELNMYEDLPMRHVEDVFEKLLYGNQKLGREILGYKETIANFKRKDFVDYIKRFYVAGDTVVCVAGKIDEEKVARKIRKIFSKMEHRPKPELEKVKEKQDAPAVKVKHKKTDQTHLMLGVRTFDMFHEDRYILQLMSTILGGNMSSRLFIQVRERQGLAYYVRSGTEFYHDAGYLVASAGVEHKDLEKSVKTILKELKNLTTKKVSEKELQKAKDFIKGKMVMNLESSDEVAGFLMEQEVSKEKIVTPEDLFAKVEKVTASDILRIAREVFVPEKLNLAIVGPHEEKKVKNFLKL